MRTRRLSFSMPRRSAARISGPRTLKRRRSTKRPLPNAFLAFPLSVRPAPNPRTGSVDIALLGRAVRMPVEDLGPAIQAQRRNVEQLDLDVRRTQDRTREIL